MNSADCIELGNTIVCRRKRIFQMNQLSADISFRMMRESEESDVVQLILTVFSEFVAPHFSDDGVLEFKKFVNEASLIERFQAGNPIIVAVLEDEIVGVIEIRENHHIALFFVKNSCQQKGIGRKMLGEAINVCRERNSSLQKITVNSSPNAYAAYQRLGFTGEQTVKTVNGISFIPLERAFGHAGPNNNKKDRHDKKSLTEGQ